jgi:hypothetical protein
VWDGPTPPWSQLLQSLRTTPGVDSARFEGATQPHPTVEIVPNPPAFHIAAALTAELDASVRTQTITDALAVALATEGVSFPGQVRPAQLAPDAWRITELPGQRIYDFRHRHHDRVIGVSESRPRFRWVLSLTHNPSVTPTGALLSLIELIKARGFTTQRPSSVRRVGKSIVVPPRV